MTSQELASMVVWIARITKRRPVDIIADAISFAETRQGTFQEYVSDLYQTAMQPKPGRAYIN